MQPNNTLNPRYVDAQLFAQNASKMLLDEASPRLAEFFQVIGYSVRPDRQGKGYYGVCPVCRAQNCFIGTNGTSHLIFWKCLDRTGACDSTRESFKTPRNLLSLTKFITGSQGNAYRAISNFLGFGDRPFDITNGKTGLSDGYTFVVDDESLKARFDAAGVYAVVYGDDMPPNALRRTIVICVTDQPDDVIIEELKGVAGVVAVQSPSAFKGLSHGSLQKRAFSVVRVAMANSKFESREP